MATVIDNVKRGKKGMPEKGQMVIDNGSIEWRGEKDGTKTLADIKDVFVGVGNPGAVAVTYGEPQQQEIFLDFRQGALKVQGQARTLEGDIRTALGLAPAGSAAPSDPVAAGNFQRMAAEAEKSAGTKGMIFGAIALAVGIGITVVTYGNASSSPSGGRYIVAWGPMLFGFIAFVQGLFRFVKANGQLQRMGQPSAVQAPPPAGPPVAYPPPAPPAQPAQTAPPPALPPAAPPPAYPPPDAPPPAP